MSVDLHRAIEARSHGVLGRVLGLPGFWVLAAALLAAVILSLATESFATPQNLFNVTRNFAFVAIVAIGMTAVIITGGIDLSVGSVMALVAIGAARVLEAGYPWWAGCLTGLLLGLLAGGVNGALIAYVRLPPFVVTLGMLSIARSLAIVLSQNRVIYQLGPGGDVFKAIGGGQIGVPWFGGQTLFLSNLFVTMLVLAVIVSFTLKWTAWGRHLFAIGGNENAARLTGIPVDRIKLQTYMFSGLTTAIAAIMLAGWQGSASNGMGKGYELYVIAATVIGGANLMGGEGSVYGAVIGAALIFLIRNSLIMFGVDANWYDLFVGLFIIFAVLLERIRARTSG